MFVCLGGRGGFVGFLGFFLVVFGSRIYQNHIVQCPRNKAILRKVKLWLDTNNRFVYDGFYPLTTFSVLKVVYENSFWIGFLVSV